MAASDYSVTAPDDDKSLFLDRFKKALRKTCAIVSSSSLHTLLFEFAADSALRVDSYSRTDSPLKRKALKLLLLIVR